MVENVHSDTRPSRRTTEKVCLVAFNKKNTMMTVGVAKILHGLY